MAGAAVEMARRRRNSLGVKHLEAWRGETKDGNERGEA
jgi:hypothetical protein